MCVVILLYSCILLLLQSCLNTSLFLVECVTVKFDLNTAHTILHAAYCFLNICFLKNIIIIIYSFNCVLFDVEDMVSMACAVAIFSVEHTCGFVVVCVCIFIVYLYSTVVVHDAVI